MNNSATFSDNEKREKLIPSKPILLPEKYSSLTPEEYVYVLIDHVEKYRSWITLHIVDFMTCKQWEILDESWRAALLPPDTAHNKSFDENKWIDSIINITTGSNIDESWPESLKNFIKDTKELALPRINPVGSQQETSTIDKKIIPGMTGKKIHEVERMTPVVTQIAADHQVHSIVDLGAGQGYLSRSIAHKNNLKVLAVDSSDIQTCGAKKFDERILRKTRTDKLELQLYHVTEFITPENASSILSKWNNVNETDTKRSDEEEDKWLLTGLHTCGDLATMMLDLFVSSQEITSFVNVGCCYHFLTEKALVKNQPSSSHFGFPRSSAVRETGFYLGGTGRMLSCQAPARWVGQVEETLMAYEHHFFRALLQLIMVEKGLTDASHAPIVGRLNKKQDFTSFPVYVKAALTRLKFHSSDTVITDEEAEAYYQEYKLKQIDKQITILWTLRALLAPVLESIILLDRWIYLNDNIPDSPTKRVWLWPLFDPVKSPRNMVIAATK